MFGSRSRLLDLHRRNFALAIGRLPAIKRDPLVRPPTRKLLAPMTTVRLQSATLIFQVFLSEITVSTPAAAGALLISLFHNLRPRVQRLCSLQDGYVGSVWFVARVHR